VPSAAFEDLEDQLRAVIEGTRIDAGTVDA
jgi:hypothetical protein